MISKIDLSALRPAERAEVIYSQARSDWSQRLWRAALGSAEESEPTVQGVATDGGAQRDFAALLSIMVEGSRPGVAAAPPADPFPASPLATGLNGARPAAEPSVATSTTLDLGVNRGLGPAVEQAAARTAIPPQALAAIINAEAAKRPDGTWQTLSRNPRSSAAGLGQFLSGTWIGEAQRSGTWLNETARARGWLTEKGRVDPAARSALLALRYDPVASVNATADYARSNLDRLRQAGVAVDGDSHAVARAAYVGHHLGAGDAIRFFKGGLETGRAHVLLNAQVGSAAASVRIARAGNAADAHRSWLLDYVGTRVQPQRFAGPERNA